MDVTLSVKRFNPDSDRPEVFYQDYQIEISDSATVLDGLIKIREEIDGTLALRCSCRSAICGSCAMRVNGQAMLACNTKIIDVISKEDGKVVVEPAGNLEVVNRLGVVLEQEVGEAEMIVSLEVEGELLDDLAELASGALVFA